MVSPPRNTRASRKFSGAILASPSWEFFRVMWSEHCSYKSSSVHLKRLPTRGPRVLQGPGENAGVVDIGDGLVRRLQNRIAQSSQLRRAISGRGHWRRRDLARYFHDGRSAHRRARFTSFRPDHAQSPGAASGNATAPTPKSRAIAASSMA